MVDFTIRVIIDPARAVRGAQQVERQLGRVDNAADRLRQTIARVFTFAAITVGIRQLVLLADAFTNVQNRLRTVTQGTEQLNVVTEELFAISNRTRSSFAATAEVYARVGLAARDLGVSQQQLLEFTESLNQAVILSGASAIEAEAGLIQLSQGLASGALRGDELRSVLEQLPVVADVIAQSLNVTRGELRELGSDGQITADIILNAFAEARDELEGRFAGAVPTIGQAFTILRNNLVALIGAFNQSSGVAQSAAQAILFLADNLEVIARVAAAAGIALAINFATRGVAVATRAVLALNAAILANPIAALITAVVGAISVLTAFSDQITVDAQGLVTLADVGVAAFDLIREGIADVVQFFDDNFGFIAEFAQTVLGDVELSFFGVLRTVATIIDNIVGLFQAGINVIVLAFESLPAALEAIFVRAFNTISELFTDFINTIINGLNIISDFAGVGGRIGRLEPLTLQVSQETIDLAQRIPQLLAEATQGTTFARDIIDDLEQRSERRAIERIVRERREVARREAATEALQRAVDDAGAAAAGDAAGQDFESFLRELEREGELLRLNIRDREIIADILRAEDAVKRQLTTTERERLVLQLELNRALAEQEAIGDFLGNLEREAELLRVSRQEREILDPILQLENQLRRQLTETETEAVDLALRRNQALRDQARILDEILGPQQDFERSLAALNALLSQGLITIDQFNARLVDLRLALLDQSTDVGAGFERGFLRAEQSLEDFASSSERLITDAFSSAQDVLVEFFQTGELNAQRFFAVLSENFLRLGTQQLFSGAFGEQGLNIGGLFGDGGFDLGSLFDFGSLFGFQRGVQNAPVDSLSVASIGGVDNRLVAFRARSDETVSVNRPGESGQRPIQIIQNISTPDVEGFRRSEGQILARTQAALQRANQRNN